MQLSSHVMVLALYTLCSLFASCCQRRLHYLTVCDMPSSFSPSESGRQYCQAVRVSTFLLLYANLDMFSWQLTLGALYCPLGFWKDCSAGSV